MIDLDTWVISDTHFGHDNIVRFCNRPENHDELMVERWLSTVKPEDTVLHLGDLAYRGARERQFEILKALPGRKLFVWGNHDKQKLAWYEQAGFEQIGKLLTSVEEHDVNSETGKAYINRVKLWGFYKHFGSTRVLFSHYPDLWKLDWATNIHGHIHNNKPSASLVTQMKNGHEYINVSVEVIDYMPVKLRLLLG